MEEKVYGMNAVRESVESRREKKLFASPKVLGHPVVVEAKKAKIPVVVAQDEALTKMIGKRYHQGLVAFVEPFAYAKLDDVLAKAKEKEYPLLLLLDGIKDPHNLGAILRSCDAFGVDGVIIKTKNEVPLNDTVARVSTGAIHYVDVVSVTNLSRTIEALKRNGYWVIGTDGSAAKSIYEETYRYPVCLVVGSEGEGISRLVLEHCDIVAKIPMVGHVNSLNASVSAGISISAVRFVQKKN